MAKRIKITIIALLLVGIIFFLCFGIYHSYAHDDSFLNSGYMLLPSTVNEKYIAFEKGEAYKVNNSGVLRFNDVNGKKQAISSQSFAHYEDGSVMAMANGVLLDCADISDNFINNYFIPAKMVISNDGNGKYFAETAEGTYTFSENIWKLSEDKYLIQSPSLKIVYSEEDVRPAGNYVQVFFDDSGIAYMLTDENLWMTVSESTYIETALGVRIYPISGIIRSHGYSMAVNKLTVNLDDQITLIPEETRRQIVPELNINAVDGKDGRNGSDGESGEDGENGLNGENGEIGTEGRAGSDGGDGVDGGQGLKGYRGDPGDSAMQETSIFSALPTMSFSKWVIESNRVYGIITVEDEGGFLAEMMSNPLLQGKFPGEVTIIDELTGKTYSCYEIPYDKVDDIYDPDALIHYSPEFWEFYTTTEAEPSIKVGFACDEVLSPDTRYRISVKAHYAAAIKADDTELFEREFINRYFYTDSVGLFLTEQKAYLDGLDIGISVGKDSRGSIKDATVYLFDNEDAAKAFELGNPTAITPVSVSISSDAAVDIEPASFSGLLPNHKYYARVYVSTDIGGGTLGELTEQVLECSTLKNPPFIQRDLEEWDNKIGENSVVVNDGIRLFYNRTNGRFEVFRPLIDDPNDGIVRYVYTPIRLSYSSDGAIQEELLVNQAITYTKSDKEPVSFLPLDNSDYKFKVDIYFDNNETEVKYERVSKDSIAAIGTGLPKVELIADKNFPEYNALRGIIRLTMSYDSHLVVDPTHVLTLNIVEDGTVVKTIEIEDRNQVYQYIMTPPSISYTFEHDEGNPYSFYSTELRQIENTNYEAINIELLNLHKNTNYRLNLSGFIDLNDGHGVTKYNFDTINIVDGERVVDRTKDTPVLRANWKENKLKDSSLSYSEYLKFTFEDPDLSQARKDWAISQIRKGRVTIKSYTMDNQLIASLTLTDEEDILKLFDTTGPGFEINDRLLKGKTQGFVLKVEQEGAVYDQSYNVAAELGYANDFIVLDGTSVTILADAVFPELPEQYAAISSYVTATEIYNTAADAARYKFSVDEDLPSDAIMGYLVQATYKDVDRLAEKITYYSMDYADFYDCLEGLADGKGYHAGTTDPILEGGANFLAEVTLNYVSTESPSVALLFGEEGSGKSLSKNGSDYQPLQTSAGVPIYYVGKVEKSEGDRLWKGMERGYHYVFACTIQYNIRGRGTEGTQYVYPYGVELSGFENRVLSGTTSTVYEKRKAERGAGYIGESGSLKIPVGEGVACVLNSGMKDAPMVTPKFVGYLYDAHMDSKSETGAAIIHYTFKDYDGEIKSDTLLHYKDPITVSNNETVSLQGDPLGNGWYRAELPTKIGAESTYPIQPWIELDKYLKSYESLSLLPVDYRRVQEQVEVCDYLAEWDYTKSFAAYRGGLKLKVTPDYARNKIAFEIIYYDGTNATDSAFSKDVLGKVLSRSYGLKLVVSSSAIGTVKEIFIPFDDSDTGKATINTASIAEFVGLTGGFSFGNTSLVYDSGNSGWMYADDGEPFGLQYTVQPTNVVTDQFAKLGKYYINGSADKDSIKPNGALMFNVGGGLLSEKLRTQFKLANLDKNIRNESADKLKTVFDFKMGSFSKTDVMLYPWMQYGVHIGSNARIPADTYNFVVPKSYAEINVLEDFPDGGSGFGEVVPTLVFNGYEPASTNILLKQYQVLGYNQIPSVHNTISGQDDYPIYVAMFDQLEYPSYESILSALDKTNHPVIDNVGMILDPKEGTTDADGPLQDEKRIVPNMNPDGKYFAAFYYINSSGERQLLLDSGKLPDGIETLQNCGYAVYNIETAKNVHIESLTGVKYVNTSYFNKAIELYYEVDRAYKVEMRYEICADDGTDTGAAIQRYYLENTGTAPAVLMDYATLQHMAILSPEKLVPNENLISIDLVPSEVRKELAPGGNYFLVMKAVEVTSDGAISTEKVVGCTAFPFTLGSVQQCDALIYTNADTKHSMEFKVTIIDEQHSIMGQLNKSNLGLYAVRFTDKDGNLIHTTYDDSVFYVGDIVKPFILSDAVGDPSEHTITDGTVLNTSEDYFIKIYAVVDDYHQNLSRSISASEDHKEDWEYFFRNSLEDTVTDRVKCANFLELVDSFWDEEGHPANSTVADRFLIARKCWKPLDEDNKEEMVTLESALLSRNRSGGYNAFRLELRESFGLDDDGVPRHPLVQWSIKGLSDDGILITANGSSYYSTGQVVLQKYTDPSTNYNMYIYDFPEKGDIPNGFYEVTIRIFDNERGEVNGNTHTVSLIYKDTVSN